jgi:hypothetical protein
MDNENIRYTDLVYGEAYRTTAEYTWSDFDNNNAHMTVPENELLIFRSFKAYPKKKASNLALFVWVNRRTTICLVTSDETPLLSVEHLEWERRHNE